MTEITTPAEIARRSKSRAKRDDVLDAAVEEILEKGYATATLASIAERAQVSTATVFKHFRTKGDLFGAIMRRIWGNEVDSLAPAPIPGDARSGLTDIGYYYARTITDPRIRALFRVMIAEVPRFPELGHELYERGKKPFLDRLHSYLESEVAAGTLSIPDVGLAVRQFLGMINDIIFWPHMLVVNLKEEQSDIDRVIEGAVDTMLRAFTPPAKSCRCINNEHL